jgi:hypothetical protein
LVLSKSLKATIRLASRASRSVGNGGNSAKNLSCPTSIASIRGNADAPTFSSRKTKSSAWQVDLQNWVMICEKIQKRGIPQYICANNRYAGFSPATYRSCFESLCREKGIETPLNVNLSMLIEGTLFDMSRRCNAHMVA